MILIIECLFAALLGAAIGALACLVSKSKWLPLIIDAGLGSAGYLFGVAVTLKINWPNTHTYPTAGGGFMTETLPFYPHFERIGFIVAACLPLIHELLRLKHQHAN
ncbi:MAG TPA: hypothetical protein VJN43_10910 [Bryobacteraceae bacterium]|nr:hypothetical protein [Bryobacteraceae bacterium]